jgi:Uma2 family endonuclease
MLELLAPATSGPISGQRMSLDEFLRLPHDGQKYELLGGQLIMTPAGLEHEDIGMKLTRAVLRYLDSKPLGRLYGSSAGYRLPNDTVLSPDLSFVRTEQLPGGRSPIGFGEFAPDLAVEIVSPGDQALDIEDKVQLYLQHGTRRVWVINPRRRIATVYAPDGTARVLQSDQLLDGEDVLPGFTCPLSDIL